MKTCHHLRWLLMITLLACALAAGAAPLLKPGGTLVFLGDSITEQRLYTRYVMNYFTLRYPGVPFAFRNVGWSGDTAVGGLQRLSRDVLSLHSSVVSICYGMNDGHYRAFSAQDYLQYMAAMTRLVTTLKQAGVQVVLLTPSCVDPQRKAALKPYNDTLMRFALGITALAESESIPAVNLYDLLQDVQMRAGKVSFIPDAVHPNPAGHAVIAYALLRALGCTDQPSGLTLDAPSAQATADRCQISGLTVGENTVSFTRTDEALPLYFEPAAAVAYPFLPLEQEMNAYRFRVTGLAAGRWRLTVQGIAVGTLTAAELAEGVNLAPLPGPWQRLGEEVNALSKTQEDWFALRWRQLALAPLPAAADPVRQALVDQFDNAIAALEKTRIEKAKAGRTWNWSLIRVE